MQTVRARVDRPEAPSSAEMLGKVRHLQLAEAEERRMEVSIMFLITIVPLYVF